MWINAGVPAWAVQKSGPGQRRLERRDVVREGGGLGSRDLIEALQGVLSTSEDEPKPGGVAAG